jgi:hypothetical protein
MKKYSLFALFSAGLFLGSCTNYAPMKYGPIEFTGAFEGPVFEQGVVDVHFDFDFKPEDYGIDRNDVYSMVMSEVKLTTDFENGFGDFENISCIIMADGVKAEKVGTLNIKGAPSEITIPGLTESEIKKFKNVKKFHFEITAVAKSGIDDIYDDINIAGSFTMNIMVPEKKAK